MKCASLLSVVSVLLPLEYGNCQSASDPNEGIRIVYDEVNDLYDFTWWGRLGRTYFVQYGEDLQSWSYLPEVEAGAAAMVTPLLRMRIATMIC